MPCSAKCSIVSLRLYAQPHSSVTCSYLVSCIKFLTASVNDANCTFHQRIAMPISSRIHSSRRRQVLNLTQFQICPILPQFIPHRGWRLWHTYSKWHVAFCVYGYANNCPTRCNTKQFFYYSESTLYMFRVSTTPTIRITQNWNYSLRYWSYFVQLPPSKVATLEGGSCTKCMTSTGGCSYSFVFSWWWVWLTPETCSMNFQNNKRTSFVLHLVGQLLMQACSIYLLSKICISFTRPASV